MINRIKYKKEKKQDENQEMDIEILGKERNAFESSNSKSYKLSNNRLKSYGIEIV